MKRVFQTVPAWVLLLSLALAATQPLIGLWLAYAPPDGYVATGLHIPDSCLFLQSMRMFSNGFESPYATCQAPATSGVEFYPLPHLWLYGLVGLIARLIGVSDFAAYFAANGIGAFVYLLVVYVFLREVAGTASTGTASTGTPPTKAGRRPNGLNGTCNLAFLLFCLSGGLGGMLYLATLPFGLHASPMFADYFRRFALYELFEGAHLQPYLYFPRLYYTLSLTFCLGALTLLIKGHRRNDRRLLVLAGAAFVPGMFIDMRYGAFTLALAFLYLWQEGAPAPPLRRARPLGHLAVPGIAAGALAWMLMATNPAAIQNHIDVANTAMWLSPFITGAALHLLVAPREVYGRAQRLPAFERVLAFAALGYLAVFGLLFAAYQAYWGNILVARDAAAALAVSDWAFIGAAAGGAWGLLRVRDNQAQPPQRDWIVLWLLSFLVLSITAFGGGWWLKFGPQRLQILLWLPLSIMSAAAIEKINSRRPGRARALTAAFVACGVCSLTAAMLFFQGPLAFRFAPAGARPPFAQYHTEIMTANDGAVIESIGKGMVVAPNLAADAVALNRPNRVVWGTGSFNMSDQPYVPMEEEVNRFFSPGTPAQWRRDFLRRWCIDWVFCPETWPVAEASVQEIGELPGTEEAAREGNAVLFHVKTDPGPI